MKTPAKKNGHWPLLVVAGIGATLGYFAFQSSADVALPRSLSAQTPSLRPVPADEAAQVVLAPPDPMRIIDSVVRESAEESPKTTAVAPSSPQKVVKDNFGTWLDLAEAQGIEIADGFVLPGELSFLFSREYEAYAKKLVAIDAVRMPILAALRETKERTGQFEEFERPASGDGASEQSRKLRAAREPTKANQTVIVSWAANRMRVVRVDAEEDSGLAGAYQALHAARREFIDNVAIHLAPHIMLHNDANTGAEEKR